MQIEAILFSQGNPENVTFTMTKFEATFIALILGGMNQNSARDIMQNGDACLHKIYSSLTGDFFNRFWDGGIEEAVRE